MTATPPLPCEHCCHPPTFKHREAQQEPYRSWWQRIVAWERDAHDRGNPIYPGELRDTLHRIASEAPVAVQSRTENTTRYGSEG